MNWIFNSFAIIATHSPLIVREIVSDNVRVMRKVDGDILRLIPVSYNTLGEDIYKTAKDLSFPASKTD